MLYTLFIQGEEARWETFKRAEKEAQRRAGLRDDAGGGRRLRTPLLTRIHRQLQGRGGKTSRVSVGTRAADRRSL